MVGRAFSPGKAGPAEAFLSAEGPRAGPRTAPPEDPRLKTDNWAFELKTGDGRLLEPKSPT